MSEEAIAQEIQAPSLPPLAGQQQQEVQEQPPQPTGFTEVVNIEDAVAQAFANANAAAAAEAEQSNKQPPPPTLDPAIWENLLGQLRYKLRQMDAGERYEHCVEIQNLAREEVSSRSNIIASQLGGGSAAAQP